MRECAAAEMGRGADALGAAAALGVTLIHVGRRVPVFLTRLLAFGDGALVAMRLFWKKALSQRLLRASSAGSMLKLGCSRA
ncbi:hypothetical protein PF001_g21440 [Phytophthora fragariae]|uniref:Uncharacterized protein n=1 Tax=Phytophthora fragariae TaxID=53985 RepID=A0A6A3S028_9STRA|nr:hypothetical protein PF006_g21398 [Phytophthora fragariae]KAE9286449.1 hypothetical protein PF001_g21440 [Phytophthora fragariae]